MRANTPGTDFPEVNRRRPWAVLAWAAVLVLLTSGCTDEPESPPGPSATATTSSESPTTEPTEPTDPTSPTSTEPAPATGPLIEQPSFTVRAPEGWTLNPQNLPFLMSASQSGGLRKVATVEIDWGSGPPIPLTRQANIALDAIKEEGEVTRLPDVELDGEPAYAIGGTLGSRQVPYLEVGTISHEAQVSLNFSLEGIPAEEQREIVESVLASFTWS